jgi:hypothetical protein
VDFNDAPYIQMSSEVFPVKRQQATNRQTQRLGNKPQRARTYTR